MDVLVDKVLASINTERELLDLPSVRLEPSYNDIATAEAEAMLQKAADAGESTLITDSNAHLYREAGLLDTHAAFVAGATRMGLLPPGMETTAGVAATEDLEGKIGDAGFAIHKLIEASPAGMKQLANNRVTHVAIGIAANSEGSIRFVEVFICRSLDVRGVTNANVSNGCVVASAREMMQANERDGEHKDGETEAPGVFQTVVAPFAHDAAVLGARIYVDCCAEGVQEAAVSTEMDDLVRELPTADLVNISAKLRHFALEGVDSLSVLRPVSTIWPWQLQARADGTYSVPIAISTAHAEAVADGTVPEDGLPHKYVVVFLLRQAGGEGEDTSSWPAIPYDGPDASADQLLTLREAPAPAVYAGARVSVIYTNDLAGGSVVTSEEAMRAVHKGRGGVSPAASGVEGLPPSIGHFSEVSIVSGEEKAGPGFRLQRLTADGAEGERSFFPVSLALADAPSLTRITAVMLLTGESDRDACAAAPDDFDVIPTNLAALVGDALSNDDTGVPSVTPAVVYLAVKRVVESRDIHDTTGALVDAAIFAAYGAEGEDSSLQSLPMPQASPGYTAQVVDLHVRTAPSFESVAEGGGEEGSEDKEATGARSIPVRISLVTTSDTDSATSSNLSVAFVSNAGVLRSQTASRIPSRLPIATTNASISVPSSSIHEAMGIMEDEGASSPPPGFTDRRSLGAMGRPDSPSDAFTPQPAVAPSLSSGYGVDGRPLRSVRDSMGSGGGAGVSMGARDSFHDDGTDRHRAQLLELLQAALLEQEQLNTANATLQKQLAVYFSLRHSDEDKDKGGGAPTPTAAATNASGNRASAAAAAFAAADKEKRYREQLDAIAEQRERLAEEHTRIESTAADLQVKVTDKEAKSGQILRAFTEFKHEIARSAVHSQTGRPIPHEELVKYESLEKEKDMAVSKVQLQHIHFASQVEKLDDRLQKREQVADGLAMIDFEQLKIENSTLNEKIEDRNEELGKLRKKATVAVQVLTHVREKLHFVSAEASRSANELNAVDAEVADQRAALASGKKERDETRVENEKAKHAQGFAQSDMMAIDFERRKREVMTLRAMIAEAQAQHSKLNAYVSKGTRSEGGAGVTMGTRR